MTLTRLSPYIAMRAQLSRRQADQAIADGRVTMDGVVVTSYNIVLTKPLFLDGKRLPEPDEARLWIYHKLPGEIVTRHDPQGRTTVFEKARHLLNYQGPLVSIGRLDYLSQGLLLLTNNPRLSHQIETSQWTRLYEVDVRGRLDERDLRTVEEGVCVEGIVYNACSIVPKKSQGSYHRLEIELDEGKNREVRVLMRAMGLHVVHLCRLRFGPLDLGRLRAGEIQEVSPSRLTTVFKALDKKKEDKQ